MKSPKLSSIPSQRLLYSAEMINSLTTAKTRNGGEEREDAERRKIKGHFCGSNSQMNSLTIANTRNGGEEEDKRTFFVAPTTVVVVVIRELLS